MTHQNHLMSFRLILLSVALIVFISTPSWAKADKNKTTSSFKQNHKRYIQDEVLILLAKEEHGNAIHSADLEMTLNGSIRQRVQLFNQNELVRLKLKKGETVESYINQQNQKKDNQRIISVEPNYLVYSDIIPNDSKFDQLWNLKNSGQSGGFVDSDIDSPAAWDISTGDENIIIAVIDSGIDYRHPDLAENIWHNPDEIADNGIDDDNNGYVDDIYGYDFLMGDAEPMDCQGHGTHCAGIIAAVSNNNQGVTGVSWQGKLMVCRFLDANGVGSTADAIEAINYAIINGARIINNSWGGNDYSPILENTIKNAQNLGIIVVASAGNQNENNDLNYTYPANYDLPNVITVAATDDRDRLATFSNYGQQTVDLGAPGANILSTVPAIKTLYSEDFDSYTSGKIPNGMSLDGSACRWGTLQDDNNVVLHCDWIHQDPYAGNTDGAIITPAIYSTNSRALKLCFDLRSEKGNNDIFTVDAWNGHGWVMIFELDYSIPLSDDYHTQAIELSDEFKHDELKIRFNWQSDSSDNSYYGIEIDNIKIECIDEDYPEESSYQWYSGTSMAAPHVSGAAALLIAANPDMSFQEVKSRLLWSGDFLAPLAGRTISSRRLNAYNALTAEDRLVMIRPYEEEVFHCDNEMTIRWASIGGLSTVRIQLMKGNEIIQTIASDADNTGQYQWHVPSNFPFGNNFKIRIDDGNNEKETHGYFTIAEPTDYSTEQFRGIYGPFDLEYKSITLTPDGEGYYDSCLNTIATFPTNPQEGTDLHLSDDDMEKIELENGMVSLYGIPFDSFWVCSNGYISFEDDDYLFDESLSNHFSQKRISALFCDLNPRMDGSVMWQELSDKVVITWYNVPRYNTSNRNNAQLELFFNGTIRMSWLKVDTTSAVIGLSNSNYIPMDFQPSNFSAYDYCQYSPPVALDYHAIIESDQPEIIELAGNDDGYPVPPGMMEYIITTVPLHGLLLDINDKVISDPCTILKDHSNIITYVPEDGYTGVDSFFFQINDGGVSPDGGLSNLACITIQVGSPPAIFTENFENGLGEFTINNRYGQGDGLWHITDSCMGQLSGHSETHCLYYGTDDQCNYNQGDTEGVLLSPEISLEGYLPPISLQFNYMLETENVSESYDIAQIEVSVNGEPFTPLLSNSAGNLDDPSGGWKQAAADLSGFAGDMIQLRIGFKTEDKANNDYAGFAVDDIHILNIVPCISINPPENPSPDNNGINVNAMSELSWNNKELNSKIIINEVPMVTYSVYFGKSSPPTHLLFENISSTRIKPTSEMTELLESDTQYYWQVIARNHCGVETSGPVWSFKTELIGDLNHNGSVEILDISNIAANWLCHCETPNWCNKADINQDGHVNLVDVAILSKSWLETVNP